MSTELNSGGGGGGGSVTVGLTDPVIFITALPATSPTTNTVAIWTEAATSLVGYLDEDGSTAKTSAAQGEISKFLNGSWRYTGITIGVGGGTFTLTKANTFPIVRQILQGSTNVTITADTANNELDIASTASGGGGITSKKSIPFFSGLELGTFTRTALADANIGLNTFKWQSDTDFVIRAPKDLILKVRDGGAFCLFIGADMYQANITSQSTISVGTEANLVKFVVTLGRGNRSEINSNATAVIRYYSKPPLGIWERDTDAGTLGTGEIQWDSNDHRDLFISNTDKFGKNAKADLDGIANGNWIGIGIDGFDGLWTAGKKTNESPGSQQAFIEFLTDNGTIAPKVTGQLVTLYEFTETQVPETIFSSSLIAPEALTKQNVYNAAKAILVHSASIATADDANQEIDIAAFTPTKANIYPTVKDILQGVPGITITEDDTNNEVDISVSYKHFHAGEELGTYNRSTAANNAGLALDTIRWVSDSEFVIRGDLDTLVIPQVDDWILLNTTSGTQYYWWLKITAVGVEINNTTDLTMDYTVALDAGNRSNFTSLATTVDLRARLFSHKPVGVWNRGNAANPAAGEVFWARNDMVDLTFRTTADAVGANVKTAMDAITTGPNGQYLGLGMKGYDRVYAYGRAHAKVSDTNDIEIEVRSLTQAPPAYASGQEIYAWIWDEEDIPFIIPQDVIGKDRIYAALKAAFLHNPTVTADDTNEEIDIADRRPVPGYVRRSLGTYNRSTVANDASVTAGNFKWANDTTLVINGAYDNIVKIEVGSFLRLISGTSNYGVNVTAVSDEINFSTTDVSKRFTVTVESGYAARSTLSNTATDVEIILYSKKPLGIWNRINSTNSSTGQFTTADADDFEELWMHPTDAIGISRQTALNAIPVGNYIWFGIEDHEGIVGAGAVTSKAVIATQGQIFYTPEQAADIPFVANKEITVYTGPINEVPAVILSPTSLSRLALYSPLKSIFVHGASIARADDTNQEIDIPAGTIAKTNRKVTYDPDGTGGVNATDITFERDDAFYADYYIAKLDRWTPGAGDTYSDLPAGRFMWDTVGKLYIQAPFESVMRIQAGASIAIRVGSDYYQVGVDSRDFSQSTDNSDSTRLQAFNVTLQIGTHSSLSSSATNVEFSFHSKRPIGTWNRETSSLPAAGQAQTSNFGVLREINLANTDKFSQNVRSAMTTQMAAGRWFGFSIRGSRGIVGLWKGTSLSTSNSGRIQAYGVPVHSVDPASYSGQEITYFSWADDEVPATLVSDQSIGQMALGANLMLYGNNFPVFDPRIGTYYLFRAAQASFTSDKVVRAENGSTNLTQAYAGDVFQWNGTFWQRVYQPPEHNISITDRTITLDRPRQDNVSIELPRQEPFYSNVLIGHLNREGTAADNAVPNGRFKWESDGTLILHADHENLRKVQIGTRIILKCGTDGYQVRVTALEQQSNTTNTSLSMKFTVTVERGTRTTMSTFCEAEITIYTERPIGVWLRLPDGGGTMAPGRIELASYDNVNRIYISHTDRYSGSLKSTLDAIAVGSYLGVGLTGYIGVAHLVRVVSKTTTATTITLAVITVDGSVPEYVAGQDVALFNWTSTQVPDVILSKSLIARHARSVHLFEGNFPETDPPTGTPLTFKEAENSFTSGKIVKRENGTTNENSAEIGDTFRFDGIQWVRQFKGIDTFHLFSLPVANVFNPPVLTDHLAFADLSATGRPTRRRPIQDFVRLNNASDTEWGTGTDTNKNPTVAQASRSIRGVKPLNVAWVGKQGAPDSSQWPNPATRKGNTTEDQYDSDNGRWWVTDQDTDIANLNWSSDSVSWEDAFFAFRMSQNNDLWACTVYWGSSSDNIANDQTIRAATNGGGMWFGNIDEADGTENFSTSAGVWNVFLVTSASSGNGVVGGLVKEGGGSAVLVKNTGTSKPHAQIAMGGDGPYYFLIQILYREVSLWADALHTSAKKLVSWPLSATQAGKFGGTNFGFAGDANSHMEKRIALYDMFVGPLSVPQAIPEFKTIE